MPVVRPLVGQQLPLWHPALRVGAHLFRLGVGARLGQAKVGQRRPFLLGKLQLFGYVATGHGGVAKDSVLAQASSWVDAFPDLSGFFLDEGPDENATEEVFDYYFDLYEAIRALGRTLCSTVPASATNGCSPLRAAEAQRAI